MSGAQLGQFVQHVGTRSRLAPTIDWEGAADKEGSAEELVGGCTAWVLSVLYFGGDEAEFETELETVGGKEAAFDPASDTLSS